MVHRAAEVAKRKGAQKEAETIARLQRKDPAELSSHKKKKKTSIYKLPTGHSQVRCPMMYGARTAHKISSVVPSPVHSLRSIILSLSFMKSTSTRAPARHTR